MHLKSVQYQLADKELSDYYPFRLSLIQSLDTISFTNPVTFFVGENGTGKSTVLEAIAAAANATTIGADSIATDPSLSAARELAQHLRLGWKLKKQRGFFLRSEDFFNFVKRMADLRAEMVQSAAEAAEIYKNRSAYTRARAMSPFTGSISAMDARYGENLDAYSHGESFLKVFSARIVPGGLYLLDEPEAALSPMRQLSLISLMKEMVEQDAQFIIATHSPVLLAYPGASILSFDEIPIAQVDYEELEHITFMKAFLNRPEQYLRHL